MRSAYASTKSFKRQAVRGNPAEPPDSDSGILVCVVAVPAAHSRVRCAHNARMSAQTLNAERTYPPMQTRRTFLGLAAALVPAALRAQAPTPAPTPPRELAR